MVDAKSNTACLVLLNFFFYGILYQAIEAAMARYLGRKLFCKIVLQEENCCSCYINT